jgi:hypothetical protein
MAFEITCPKILLTSSLCPVLSGTKIKECINSRMHKRDGEIANTNNFLRNVLNVIHVRSQNVDIIRVNLILKKRNAT